ncbi:MAG: PIN domain-containing protein [Deltaproteobacteria bacterium]|nr:PIN domain-containing protein [Deltaproteobacteria bacterium]
MRKGPPRDAGVRRVFVDSGAWIALVSGRDRHHGEADRMVSLAVARRIELLTTSLVLAEVHRFLLFHAGIAPAIRTLERIESSPRVVLRFPGPEDHAAARRWLARLADQVITYTDAVSFATMDAARCPTALSFDHDFTVAGFRLWQHLE